MISLNRVIKKFGQRLAVNDLSLTVPRGEIFGLLGHNGAGKSTAIGMMLGQVWPTGGEVTVCGHDVTTHRARALAKVGAIFETPAFYDYLSGWRNLEILTHYTAATSKARIQEVVEWVGLTGREHGRVKTYSHGMRARLALAQALLPQPELLILDEPGEGLDPEGIHEMRQTILRLHRELNLTILLSSHLLSEVEQICARIAVLNQGRKVFEGTVAEIKSASSRVLLKVNDFARAVSLLSDRALIASVPGGGSVTLADGKSTGEISRVLVEAGFTVDGIWQQEQTLEDFYLNLVKNPPPLPPGHMSMFYLQLRNELWKLFGKKRTYIGFGAFLVVQILITLLFRLTKASRPMQRLLEGNGYLAEEYISALTIATIMLIPIAGLLLPLYVALIGGDLVAKEAEDGTLRMILARPISRVRLLVTKWLAGVVFSFCLVATLALFGLVFARLTFPWGGMFVWMPEQGIFSVFDANAGLAHYLAANLMLTSEAVSLMGLAFMFSCFNIKPAAATILALSISFVDYIMFHIPFFSEYQAWFLTYHLQVWQWMFQENFNWAKVLESISMLTGFNLTFLFIGSTVFQLRDIKS